MTAEKETASFVNSCLSAQTWSIFAYISQPSVNVNPCLFDERGVKYPKGKSRKTSTTLQRDSPPIGQTHVYEPVYIHYIDQYTALRIYVFGRFARAVLQVGKL